MALRTALALVLASLTCTVFAQSALADPLTGPTTTADTYAVAGAGPLHVDAVSGVLANDTGTPPLTAAIDAGPANGTLTLNVDGSFDYAPNLGFFGDDTFTYTATDATGISAPTDVTISVGPAPPAPLVAVDDAYTAYQDNVLTVDAAAGVLANDTSGTPPLSAALVADATNGSAILNPDGSFTYTPNAGYTGDDSFTYQASDATPSTSPVTTVTIHVAGAPTAADDSYSVGANATLTVGALNGVLANDTGYAMSAVIDTSPSNGSVALNDDGTFTYVPNADFAGTDTFTYFAHEGPLTSSVATVTITVTPTPPANDNMADAHPLGSDSGTYNGSLVFATSEPTDPYNGALYPSVWFSITPTQSAQLEIDTCGTGFDHYIVLTDTAGNPITNAYDSCTYGHLTIDVTAGTTYLLDVAGYYGQTGHYTVNWHLNGPPANDNFANAQVLTSDSGTVTGTTLLATQEATDPWWYASPTVWYAYTPSQDGQLDVDTCGSSNVGYVGITDAAGNPLAGPNYYSCYYGHPELNVTAGVTYMFMVSGYYGSYTGPIQLNWTLHTRPTNDNRADAQLLSGDNGRVDGTTVAATTEPDDPIAGWSQSVWYTYTPSTDGFARFDTCDSGSYVAFVLLDSTGTEVAREYGGCDGLNTSVTGGETYTLGVFTPSTGTDFSLHYQLFLVPANDALSSPETLSGDSGSVSGNNTAATADPSGLGSGGHDVFFEWTPSADETGIFSMRGGPFSGYLNVVVPDGAGGWTSLAHGDRVVFAATAGTTYTIALDGRSSGAFGDWTLNWASGPSPANDNFANAEALSGDEGSVTGNNDYSTAEPIDMTSGGQNNWYTYTPSADGTLELYVGNSASEGQQIAVGTLDTAGNPSTIASGTGRITARVTGGDTYYIQIDTTDSGGGCGEGCDSATLNSSGILGGSTGGYTLNYELYAPPANDLSANAIALSGDTGSIGGTTLGATDTGDSFTANGSGVWYTINPGRYGRLTINANGNTFYPQISVGPLGGAPATGFGSVQTLTDGTTPLYIEVDGDPSAQSDFSLSWSFQELTPPSGAVRDLAFCNSNTFFRNDDSSTGPIPIGFTLNFFGNTFSSLFVNNNGNVTFTRALGTYTPFNVSTSTGLPIIAPYFADVDTRNSASGQVHYGAGTVDGFPAFCVNWLDTGYAGHKGVGYYGAHADKLNTFQLLLVGRNDLGLGDFTIEMNYDNMQWETGDASGGSGGFGGTPAEVGYTNGSGRSFVLPGSFTSGALTDTNRFGVASPTALVNHGLNSPDQRGRYIFQVSNGDAPIGQNINGHVFLNDATHPLPNAIVQVCTDAGYCFIGNSGGDGAYSFSGVPDGHVRISAFPPSGVAGVVQVLDATMAGTPLNGENLTLRAPVPPPPGEGLTPSRSNGDVVYWLDDLTLGAHDCAGGTADYSIDWTQSQDPSLGIQTGSMTESASEPGFYTAPIGVLYPRHGHIEITTTIHCPDGSTSVEIFDIYIDPSGTVVDQSHHPIASATVTLSRSATETGTFTTVPTGSAIMSSTNRNNPDSTDSAGHFGWDVISGWYKVTASAPGCTSATTAPTQVPPAVMDIVITLVCTSPSSTTLSVSPNPQVVTKAVTLSAHVSGNSPTGTVHFTGVGGSSSGAIDFGTVSVDAAGDATTTTTFTDPGTYHVVADYLGDGSNYGSTSSAVDEIVNLDAAVATLDSSLNPSFYGQNVTFTTTVTGDGLLPSPTGTVSVAIDGGPVTDVAVVDGGVPGTGTASFSTSAFTPGLHSINVQYNGDAIHSTSTASLTQSVNADPSHTALSSDGNPSIFGDPVTFTAHVTSDHGATPDGFVQFRLDGSPIGTGLTSLDAHGDASFTAPSLSAGDHSVEAYYASATGNFGASIGSMSQTVGKHPTNTTLTSSNNPSSYGDGVTFNVDVTGPVVGAVNFRIDGTFQVLTLAGGHASYSTSTLSVGPHTVTASYVGDSTYEASDAPAITQTVTKASTALTLFSSANPSTVGQLVGLTAHVQTPAGAPVSEGSVFFTDGGSFVGIAALDALGNAVVSVPFTTVGLHAIHASFPGSIDYDPSDGDLTQSVGQAHSSTSVVASPNPAAYGAGVTLTATVTGYSPGGVVTFTTGTTTLGSAAVASDGTASIGGLHLDAGSYPILAGYGGDAASAASSGTTTLAVSKADTATVLVSSSNPSVIGQTVGFTARLADPIAGALFQFEIDGVVVGGVHADAAGNAVYSTAFTTPGNHTVVARFAGDGNHNGSASAPLSQAVSKASPAASVGSAPNPSTFGQAVTITATVSGGYSPTGTVTFKDGATPLGTVPLASGTASIVTSGLVVGGHPLTAQYNGDPANNGAVSVSSTQNVNKAGTATSVASSVNPSTFGQSVTFTATVSSIGAGIPAGSVAFTDGATSLGTAPLDATGHATLSVSTLGAASHSITATYGGGTNYDGSAGSVTQVVNRASSTTTVTSSLNPAPITQAVTFMANVSSAAGIPGGTVTFLDGSTTIGTATLTIAGQATLVTSTLTAGTHPITVAYGGATNYGPSTSAVLSQVINPGTTLKASKLMYLGPGSTRSKKPTLIARLSDAGNLLIGLSGRTVRFSIDGGAPQSTSTVLLGFATIDVTHPLAFGTHTVVITFAGDTQYAGTSVTATFVVVHPGEHSDDDGDRGDDRGDRD